MTFGTRCREALARERERLGGKITAEQWDGVVNAMFALETVTKKRKPKGAPRERNPLFDALALATGTKNLAEISRMQGKAIGVSLADIMEVSPGLTAAEIERRAAAYRSRHRDWPLTAPALAKHWGEFGGDRTKSAKMDAYQEPTGDWRWAALQRYNDTVSQTPWFDLGVDIRTEILKEMAR